MTVLYSCRASKVSPLPAYLRNTVLTLAAGDIRRIMLKTMHLYATFLDAARLSIAKICCNGTRRGSESFWTIQEYMY